MDVTVTEPDDVETEFLDIVNIVLFLELVNNFVTSMAVNYLQIEIVNIRYTVGVTAPDELWMGGSDRYLSFVVTDPLETCVVFLKAVIAPFLGFNSPVFQTCDCVTQEFPSEGHKGGPAMPESVTLVNFIVLFIKSRLIFDSVMVSTSQVSFDFRKGVTHIYNTILRHRVWNSG